MKHSAPQVRSAIECDFFFVVYTDGLQLKDQSLFIEKAYINGEWVDAKSGETFEVHGKTKLNTRVLDR